MDLTPWAERRKAVFTGVALAIVLLLVSVQLFRVTNKPANCFDNRHNGGESGVDCGGECMRMCRADVADLRVEWERVFEVREGVYTAVAYVENPNRNAGVRDAAYTFVVYGRDGGVIETVEGSTFVRPASSFPVFAGPFQLEEEPSQAAFSFADAPVWVRVAETEEAILVENTTLLSSETAPKLRAVLNNTTIEDIEDIGVVALISDSAGNAVAASRTVVDLLISNQSDTITFTWPEPFDVRQSVCIEPTGTLLAIDRSGSMNDDSVSPPQPITDVLESAGFFVSSLGANDKIGIVSFATQASDPADLGLTFDTETAEAVVSDITILPADENGYTNIGDAIRVAREEIEREPEFGAGERKFVIVLLTDGIANYPEVPGGEPYAREQATIAKRGGIDMYTIGLGESINREFLKDVATAPEYYFEAATTDDLAGIYEEIGTSVCTLGPATIEIFPRFNDVPELR